MCRIKSRAGVTRNRFFGGYAGQLSDWNQYVKRGYPRLEDAPTITAKTLPSEPPGEPSTAFVLGDLKRHEDLSVSSIINQHLWDKARWNGMSYGYSPNGEPPMVGLMFKNADNAKAIFREWRERFGKVDEKDEIRISVVKGIDSDNPYHYRVCVGRDFDAVDTNDLRQFISVTRLNTMTVDNHQNLDMFLKNLRMHGFFFLAPATVDTLGQCEFIPELAIAKSKFHVREAWQIGMHDVDVMGVSLTDKVIIPDDQDNAPVIELLKWKRESSSN